MSTRRALIAFAVVFAAGCGSSGGGAPDLAAQPDLTVTKRVFITRSVYNGNLGGLTGADQICTDSARAANLGGAWKAWLSDSAMNAIDRIADVGPWTRLDGVRIFDNKAQLMSTPFANIDVDEGKQQQRGQQVWTGTKLGGTVAPTGIKVTCKDWFDNGAGVGPGPFGAVGNADFKDKQWTEYSSSVLCNLHLNLYCLEQ